MRMNMRVNYNHNQPETADFPDFISLYIIHVEELEARERKRNKENADILVFFSIIFS